MSGAVGDALRARAPSNAGCRPRRPGRPPLVDETPVNRETEATTDPGLRVAEELERRRRAQTLPRRCALSPPEAFSADPAPPEALARLCPGIDPAETG